MGMLMLLMSGSGSDSSSLPLMGMMGGNMDPMMLVLMMSMNTCTEPIKDCIEPNNDHKLICELWRICQSALLPSKQPRIQQLASLALMLSNHAVNVHTRRKACFRIVLS